MNQEDLRKMAEERIQDAKVLLDGQRWEFAYYAAGYAVECGLKSCVLSRMIRTGLVFKEEVKAIKEFQVHDFQKLIVFSGLKDELISRLKESAVAKDGFNGNWKIAESWTVDSRYLAKTQTEAEELYKAIADKPNGVLEWIQKFW